MPRYKLTIAYTGTDYCGWQRQEGHPSVQQVLEEALTHFCQEVTEVAGAGRTDTGVHALGQVAHCDLHKDVDPARFRDGMNFYLRDTGIVLLQCEEVSFKFHARFSAIKRHYLYRILNRRVASPFEIDRAWHVISPLNLSTMQEAATYFVGHHDFSAFRAAECQSSSGFKTLDHFIVTGEDAMIFVRVASRSFLHNQVRIMMGTLVNVGLGKWPPDHVQHILAHKDRTQAGPTAPAHGLYLIGVDYSYE